MPDKPAHRGLRNRSDEVLREVAAGATYEITNHGEVVAQVRRDRPVQEVLDDLRGER